MNCRTLILNGKNAAAHGKLTSYIDFCACPLPTPQVGECVCTFERVRQSKVQNMTTENRLVFVDGFVYFGLGARHNYQHDLRVNDENVNS